LPSPTGSLAGWAESVLEPRAVREEGGQGGLEQAVTAETKEAREPG
jgi:hypothetical protein